MIRWSDYPNFTEYEMACPDCGVSNISKHFMEKLQKARNIAGIPFRMSEGSACRCIKHNEEVDGVSDSAHLSTESLKCQAGDIPIRNTREKFIVVTALLEAGFTRIGVYDTWIHADCSLHKDQKVMW